MTAELTHTGRAIRVAIKTTASATHAWQAWTDPQQLSRWFADRADGECQTGNLVTWKFERFDMEMRYRVLFVEEGRRLVLGPEAAPLPFKLEIQVKEGEGETIIRVINSGLEEDADLDEEIGGIESGWQMALGILKHYLENYWGKDRQSFFAVREASFEYDELITFYREEFKLAQWLTNEGAVVPGKSTVRLVLRDGRAISGPILAETPREIALAWDEINGVIEFKAFSLGPDQRAVCIRGCGWGLSTEEARVIESSMEGALERLVAVLEQ